MRTLRHLLILLLMAGLLPWCGVASAWAGGAGADALTRADTILPAAEARADARADRILDGPAEAKETRFLSLSTLHCSGAVGVLPAEPALADARGPHARAAEPVCSLTGLTRAPPRTPPRAA
ncbi:hypothetical protein FIU94_02595 [Sulfitobacter sp. THAF37]|uniref:hypothetical protein n=1 Tax=Sulfitobacter sp. THAF37 TaxID=2587855 RepID=UPI00126856B3|nr:hypothetical protein [Sulfitobacter sp. THAF37]QFT57702.1 hypothetical protein FIU94_02595 [Sulfitobacter sp. THAF37]